MKVGFWDFGGLKWTVVEELEGAVLDKPAVSPGQRQEMPRHTGPIAKSACGEGWESKNDPRKKKC